MSQIISLTWKNPTVSSRGSRVIRENTFLHIFVISPWFLAMFHLESHAHVGNRKNILTPFHANTFIPPSLSRGSIYLAVFHSLKVLRFPFQMLQSHVLKIRNPKPSFVVQPSICISSGLCVTLGYIQWHLHVYLLSEWTLKADSLLLSRLMPQCFPWHLYTVSFSAASPQWTDKHSQWCSNFTVVAFFDLWYCRACLGHAVEESSLYEMS